jgi:chaperone BCS1
MSSIVLEPGVKDMILNDCKDFLRSEEWYAERGEDRWMSRAGDIDL